MTRPTQRLETGTRHVLAWCTGCPLWRTLTGTTAAAHLAAADHAQLVHGDKSAAKEHRRRARVVGNGGGNTTTG